VTRVRVLWCVFAAGCAGSSDVETDGVFQAPDITGRYDVQVAGTNGCDSNASLILDWAVGPMVVSGDASSLTFDFLDGVAMVGTVDDTYSVQFGGVVSMPPWELAAFAAGSVVDDTGRWVMTGRFEGTADDDGVQGNDCTIEAPFTATWLGS
jgi:hypothetical protein